ncbi:(2Fe-2S) ferredoxin domain-containing protein [Okeania sp.]|uniref:(2Fe-2S) ferredoxin domain-containing protein n=1 Tax=Okeania sp. TaxID=3100323 RepID=UPI002B4B457F|nr:(2Fe-2S) ferredoxin domain-containing protein [Okeania sp.]MEB3343805.1 (2Fe-2S) ferredoxin domain-containing protein [Okeania sp.]
MSKFKYLKKFSLEGKIQEVTIKDGYKLKYIHVETPAGNNYVVKVAKHLRRNFSSVLIPGLEVKITGEMAVCKKTGEEELKAFEIIPDFQNLPLLKSGEDVFSPIRDLTLPKTKDIVSKSEKVTGDNTKFANKKAQILICKKSDCQKRGAEEICQALSQALFDKNLQEKVIIKKTGCLKKCKAGPNIIVMPSKAKYSRVSSAEIPGVIEKHFDN